MNSRFQRKWFLLSGNFPAQLFQTHVHALIDIFHLLFYRNEKNGIPADIINILDCAVEIPQLGVVRSLNVHVTAAIFMWEYSKQHLMPNVNVSR